MAPVGQYGRGRTVPLNVDNHVQLESEPALSEFLAEVRALLPRVESTWDHGIKARPP